MADKNPRRNPTTDALFDAILSLETREECYNFFEDLCTVKEISDMAQRLEAAKLGVPLLGKIPLDISTRFGGDEGRPVALEDPGQNPVSAAFRQVAEQCARVVLDR